MNWLNRHAAKTLHAALALHPFCKSRCTENLTQQAILQITLHAALLQILGFGWLFEGVLSTAIAYLLSRLGEN
jgi:hypothetical protein